MACNLKTSHKKVLKELVHSLRQLLNEQRVQRIPGLKNFEVRFENWNVGSLC